MADGETICRGTVGAQLHWQTLEEKCIKIEERMLCFSYSRKEKITDTEVMIMSNKLSSGCKGPMYLVNFRKDYLN